MLRDATLEDLPAVLGLYAQLHPRDPELDAVVAQDRLAEIQATPGLRLLVLDTDDGVVSASAYLNIIPNLTRSAAPYAILENVVVQESLRGRGYGKQLVTGALELAWEAGCYKVMLLTGRESTHVFYGSCGFMPGEKTAFVAHPAATGA